MRAVLTCCMAFAAAPPLFAQERWERQVQDRISRATHALGSRPAPALSVFTHTGSLNTDEVAAFQTMLKRGTPYTIIAVCDDDCSLLQLTLLKPGGSEIAKDRNSESLPVLHFTSDTTMVYGVRIMMEGCHWNPCWYAVAVVPLGKNPP